MRTAKQAVAVFVCLAVLIPQVDLKAASQDSKIKAQLEAFPIGSVIEIRLSSGAKVIGKLDSLTEDRVTLQIEGLKGIAKNTYSIGDIAEVVIPDEQRSEVRWSELGRFYEAAKLHGRRQVMLVLPDGTMVQGQIVNVEKDELSFNVSKSSDRRAYPKGRISIPRSSITTIQLTQIKGPFRFLLAVVGYVEAFEAADHSLGDSSGAQAIGISLVAGSTVGGYYAGRSLDRKTTVVKVLPD